MHWEFVLAGYAIVLGSLLLYTTYVLRRGRALSRQLPAERRRFLDR